MPFFDKAIYNLFVDLGKHFDRIKSEEFDTYCHLNQQCMLINDGLVHFSLNKDSPVFSKSFFSLPPSPSLEAE